MNDIQYIKDDQNNKTSAIVPIEIWDKINNDELKYNNLKEKDTPYTFMIQHFRELLDLLYMHKDFAKNGEGFDDTEWRNLADDYFKYYNALDEYDINILYYFRSNHLFTLSNDISSVTEKFNTDLARIKTLTNQKFTISHHLEFRKKIEFCNEFSLLQYFKLNYKKDIQEGTTKRLQRIPSRNRLLVYDLLFICDYLVDEEELKKYPEIMKSRKNIIKFIAKIFYNNQETQVYRLYQEAQRNVNLF